MQVSLKSLNIQVGENGRPIKGTSKRISKSEVRVSGRTIQRGTDNSRYLIIKATQALQQSGVVEVSQVDNPALETINFFNAIGCSIENTGRANYTLLDKQTDSTSVDNPNIQEGPPPRKMISANSSFEAFEGDPFYEADLPRSEAKKQRMSMQRTMAAGRAATNLAAGIAELNARTRSGKIKQFVKPQRTSMGARAQIAIPTLSE